MRFFGPGNSRRAQRGMTMIEVLTVAAIIGLLASIAVPWFVKARGSSEDAAFINDLRVATSGIITYSLVNKAYPPDQGPGVPPAGMEGFFTRRLRWAAPTPIGGRWDWDYDTYGFRAAVSVSHPVRTPAQMIEIDRKLDDGDLNSGIFRVRPDGSGYLYLIEE